MCASRPEEDSSKLTHAVRRRTGSLAEGTGDDSCWEGEHSLGHPRGSGVSVAGLHICRSNSEPQRV